MSEYEQDAFIAFWTQTLKDHKQPYLQVRLAQNNEIDSLLPKMKVDHESFKLGRYYFQFAPVDTQASGMPLKSYLNSITSDDLGKNAVIDLGAEMIHLDGSSADQPITKDFERAFIKKYVFA